MPVLASQTLREKEECACFSLPDPKGEGRDTLVYASLGMVEGGIPPVYASLRTVCRCTMPSLACCTDTLWTMYRVLCITRVDSFTLLARRLRVVGIIPENSPKGVIPGSNVRKGSFHGAIP